jgi:hypothetical protein
MTSPRRKGTAIRLRRREEHRRRSSWSMLPEILRRQVASTTRRPSSGMTPHQTRDRCGPVVLDDRHQSGGHRGQHRCRDDILAALPSSAAAPKIDAGIEHTEDGERVHARLLNNTHRRDRSMARSTAPSIDGHEQQECDRPRRSKPKGRSMTSGPRFRRSVAQSAPRMREPIEECNHTTIHLPSFLIQPT